MKTKIKTQTVLKSIRKQFYYLLNDADNNYRDSRIQKMVSIVEDIEILERQLTKV